MKKITTILSVCMLTLFAWQTQAQTEIPQANATLTSGVDFVDGDIYTDSGGTAGNYLNNELSTLNLEAGPGETITITFTAFEVEASSGPFCFDNLTVTGDDNGLDDTYSGDDIDAGAGLPCTDATDPLGNPTLGPFVSAIGGTLSFLFDSDSSIQKSGWAATITIGGAGPITECGNAPELIPNVGTTGPMNPSIANVGSVGVVGTNYSIDNVSLNIEHSWADDLDISLTSPGGITIDLSSDNGGRFGLTPAADLVFTDASVNDVTMWGSVPPLADYQAEEGLLNTLFDGEPVNGNWTLSINDDTNGDDGVLNSYCITFSPILGDPPMITCPPNLAYNTDPGQCGAVANYFALATDPDGDLDTIVQTVPDPLVLASGDEFPVGTTSVTFRATDLAGNFSECTFDIVVTDNEMPVATCQDITVQLDATGMASIVPGDINNGSSDNCPGLTYEMGVVGTPVAGSLTTTFASNNGFAGNMFEVMPLNDITVNSFDVNSGSGGTVDYEVYFKTGSYLGSETNAGDWTLVGSAIGIASAGTDNPTPLGLNMGVDLTAGNMVSFYVTQTNGTDHNYVNGTTEGALWAADANLEIYEGVGKATPIFTGSTFRPRNFSGTILYEAGGGIVPFSGDFDCSNTGVNEITLIVTDPSGNVSTCTSNVTVEDNILPEIVCIGEQLIGPNTVSDAPGIGIIDNTTVSTTINIAESFTITDLNVDMNITHTWVGDLTITLESPALTQVVIFDGGADGCSGDNIYDLYDDESANPLSCVPASGDAFPLADYIPSNALSAFDGEDTAGVWTLYVADGAGGDVGTIDSWSLIYDFAPIVAAPLEVDLDANGNATINASDLLLNVNEACGWTATVGGAPNPFTLLTTLAGGNGNFGNMFDINALNDITIDSFDVHGEDGVTFDVDVYAKAGTYVGFETDAAAWTLIGTAPGVVSNGSGVVTPLNLALGYAMAAGETHAFFVTPQDSTTGGFQYTNGTTVGAVFASDANMEFLEGAGSGIFNGTVFSPRVFNGNIQYSQGAGVSTTLDLDCSNLGENIIEVTVTDDSGNVATCMATVNVNDVTAPILVCQDVTIELGPDGTAIVDPMALLANLPSTYNVISISSDNQSGAPGETDITVPVTAADNITFDWDYSTPDGPAFDSFGYLLNGVFTELTDPAGATNQNGTAGPIAVAPGDVFGFRSASVDGVFGACTTVVSNFIPGFTGQFAPANWTETLNNSDGSATFVEIPGGPLSFDACGITVLAVDITEVTCADIGTPVTITVFASDSSLNSAVCVATVTVVDLLAPVVTCPADITVDPGPGNLFYEVPDYYATGEATAEDNCTDPLTLLTQDPAAGTLLPDGVYPVTMTAEDDEGNVGTCTFTLTVESVLGLDDNELDIAISMYPNPADSQVTISNSSNIALEKATIYDMNGKLIQQVDLSQMTGEKVIDVSYLSAGVYVVQITSDNSSAVKRLIKE